MQVTAVYFSATGTSKRNAASIAEGFAGHAGFETLDLTPFSELAVPRRFGADDFVVFSAPCYKGRIPIVAMERLRTLRGDRTACIITVTYGNRDYDDALLELHDLVRENGFLPVAAAALIGQHTYGVIQPGRPDESDMEANRRFARAVRGKQQAAPEKEATLTIQGERPYRGEGSGGSFRPLTSADCTHCGLCVRECPVRAIGEDCVTVAGHCLACFRCIQICPAQAKNMDTPEYRGFAEAFSRQLATRRENEYILS